MEKEVFTLKEAAEFLQLSKGSLYKLARGGEIPGKKVLSRWRFEKDTLKRWLSVGEGGKKYNQGEESRENVKNSALCPYR